MHSTEVPATEKWAWTVKRTTAIGQGDRLQKRDVALENIHGGKHESVQKNKI